MPQQPIGHGNNIPTISRNTQSKSHTLPLTECILESQNITLWDTHYHVLLITSVCKISKSNVGMYKEFEKERGVSLSGIDY